jgi:WD repeat-containing protein 35
MNRKGTIADDLSETIKLRGVKIALTEWLPFDRNQLAALNAKLDSLHLNRGHIITALTDNEPNSIVFHDQGVSCKIIVQDFESSEFVSFKAILSYPEHEKITQNEALSGYVNAWGKTVFGADLFSVEGEENGWVSLDVLTRIIVDLTMDSSKMIDSLLTEYQRNLLDLIYLGESIQRPKFLLLMADDISVHPDNAQDFFDGEDLQNELEQVLGVLHTVKPLDNGFVFTGNYGIIVVSQKASEYEQSYLEQSFSSAIRLFLDDYSARIWHLWDESRLIENDINKAMLGDVTSLTRAQNWITQSSSEAIILGNILSYLKDSINEFMNELTHKNPQRSTDDALIEELNAILLDSQVTTNRVKDTRKVIQGLETKMAALRDFSNALAEKHMRKISDSMAQNTQSMMQMTESNNRASDALSIIELILAGSVILEIVLLVVGEYAYPDWLAGLFASNYGSLVVLSISIILWLGVFIFLRVSKRKLESQAIRRQTGTFSIARLCNVDKLEQYLNSKDILMRNIESEGDSEIISVTWQPQNNKKLQHKLENVVLSYDAKEEFIIQVYMENSNMSVDLKECFSHLIAELKKADIFKS